MAKSNRGASFVAPMLLLSSETLPDGRDWLYELKLDGYRALALKTRGKVQLRLRHDNDFTAVSTSESCVAHSPEVIWIGAHSGARPA